MKREGRRKRTIKCFTVNIIYAFVFGDEVVEFLVWSLDGAELVFFIEEVST